MNVMSTQTEIFGRYQSSTASAIAFQQGLLSKPTPFCSAARFSWDFIVPQVAKTTCQSNLGTVSCHTVEQACVKAAKPPPFSVKLQFHLTSQTLWVQLGAQFHYITSMECSVLQPYLRSSWRQQSMLPFAPSHPRTSKKLMKFEMS